MEGSFEMSYYVHPKALCRYMHTCKMCFCALCAYVYSRFVRSILSPNLATDDCLVFFRAFFGLEMERKLELFF